MEQRWENLLFLHWRVPPGRIQETLPAGLTVDTFEGQAWIGLTPFFMRNVRLRALPAIPWFSNFQELNVRTYAFDFDGTPGVWFYSLEFFLLERYYLFASRPANRTLLRGQIAHASYQLRDAEVVQFSALPAQLDGFSEISDPPDHVCLVDGFDVNIFGQEKIV